MVGGNNFNQQANMVQQNVLEGSLINLTNSSNAMTNLNSPTNMLPDNGSAGANNMMIYNTNHAKN